MSARRVTADEAQALLDGIVEADALVCTHDASSVHFGCLCQSCSKQHEAYGAAHAASTDLAATVIAQAEEIERLRAVIIDAEDDLDGVHAEDCAHSANEYASCDCTVGHARAALTKSVSR